MSLIEPFGRLLQAMLSSQVAPSTPTEKRSQRQKRSRTFEQLEPRTLMSVSQDANGWTNVAASADTRTIYVSSSNGNDANDGLSPGSAKATIAAGAALLRPNFPDHLLLKRGDSFSLANTISSPTGRSATEPALLGAYGTGARPRIDGGDTTPIKLFKRQFVYIIGWHLESSRTVASTTDGIDIFDGVDGGNGGNFLIEDCYIRGYQKNIRINGQDGYLIPGVKIRRNVIVDAWSTIAHSQGMYADNTTGMIVEENVFDHNGWNESIAGAKATIFNHNMYISWDNRNVTVRGNISSRSSSHGLKMQPSDGEVTIENNLFVRNGSIGQTGGSESYSGKAGLGLVVAIRNNVAIEGDSTGAPGNNGLGWTLQNIESGVFENNIIANRAAAGNIGYAMECVDNPADPIAYGVHNLTLRDNIIHNWRGPVRLLDAPSYEHSGIVFVDNSFQEPNSSGKKLVDIAKSSSAVNEFRDNTYYTNEPANSWFIIAGAGQSFAQWQTTVDATAQQEKASYFDPTRTSRTYAAGLGLTSYDQLIAEMRSQSRDAWRTEFTADAVNEYIRAGFEPDLVGITPLPSPRLGAPAGQSLQQTTPPEQGNNVQSASISFYAGQEQSLASDDSQPSDSNDMAPSVTSSSEALDQLLDGLEDVSAASADADDDTLGTSSDSDVEDEGTNAATDDAFGELGSPLTSTLQQRIIGRRGAFSRR